jgi:hypothetical protein
LKEIAMKKLICTRQFTSGLIPAGKDGLVTIGRVFDAPDGLAAELVARGFAKPAEAAAPADPTPRAPGMTARSAPQDED